MQLSAPKNKYVLSTLPMGGYFDEDHNAHPLCSCNSKLKFWILAKGTLGFFVSLGGHQVHLERD